MSHKKFPEEKKLTKKISQKKNFLKSQKNLEKSGPHFLAVEGCSFPQELEKSQPKDGNFSSLHKLWTVCRIL